MIGDQISAMSKRLYVYILTNARNTVLYTGVTNNLLRRVAEHRMKIGSRFTARYNVHKLVFYQCYDDPRLAIAEEKRIKGGSRAKKIALVNSMNPEWRDLLNQ